MNAAEAARQKVKFNGNWKFNLHDAAGAEQTEYADNNWDNVCLPHTPKIEDLQVYQHFQGICWYRKHFVIDKANKGKKLFIEFEAAMQEADVWVNGRFKCNHKGGYMPFTIDITDDIHWDEANVIAVRLDNRDNEHIPPGKPLNALDFCYFGGLYRNAHLHVMDKLHMTDAVFANIPAGGGIFVRYHDVSAQSATVAVQTHVINEHAEGYQAKIVQTLADQHDKIVAVSESSSQSISAGEDCTFNQSIEVASPLLWHPDFPHLYTLKTEIVTDSGVMDQRTTRIGIRTISFSEADGFMINHDKLVIRGANRHQQFPYLGNAASDRAQYRDAVKLKEGGFNFVRLAHYPQSPAFLDACDELGLLVVEPIPGWQWCRAGQFQEISKQNTRDMVRRDRNRPSIIMWEVSLNETPSHYEGATDTFFRECNEIAHEEYPGDQMFTCGDMIGRPDPAFVNFDISFTGWDEATFTRPNFPGKPGLDREYGDWEFGGNESTSRQTRGDGENGMLLQAWNYQWELNRNRSYGMSIGDAIWVGIDYNRGYYPERPLCECGAMDTFRLPKFVYYFYQSQRRPDIVHEKIDSGPMVYIANYWTERVSPSKVVVFSNCDEVELFINGKSVGIQKPDQGPDTEYGTRKTGGGVDYFLTNEGLPENYEGNLTEITGETQQEDVQFDGGNCRHLDRPPFTFRNVTYEPGELKAVGRIHDEEVAVHTVQTPLDPESISIQFGTSGKDLAADGADFIFIYAEVKDMNGTIVPTNDHTITFAVSGPGRIVGHNPIKAEAGLATVLHQADAQPGEIVVTAQAEGLKQASAVITSITA